SFRMLGDTFILLEIRQQGLFLCLSEFYLAPRVIIIFCISVLNFFWRPVMVSSMFILSWVLIAFFNVGLVPKNDKITNKTTMSKPIVSVELIIKFAPSTMGLSPLWLINYS
ncbi:hypothetical protein ABES20_07035, partial [Geobacillus stearothermophilus]|uniref:hypothetical protein n=1 Tax=Geobacillus stearothermophilus TaxID=1422 RepID=UPI003D1A5E00